MKNLLATIDLYDDDTPGMADGGRAGFSNGGIDILKAEEEAFNRALKAFDYYKSTGGKKNFRDYLRQAGERGDQFRAEGGRIGFKDGPKKTLTGEKFIEIAEKFPDKSNVELLEYFNKNNFVNRTGDPLSLGAISTQKSKFFDVAAETKAKIPKGYIKSTDVFKNLPISKKDYFRVKQAKEGGTLLTKEIDKLLKPVKIGETFYFKNPNKTDLKSFVRLADKTGRLDNRIADLMIEFDKVYGKNFANGIIPDIEDVKQKFNITDSTAGKVTTRLAQWYGGQDFKNPQLKNLKRNKVASNRMFKTIEKSQFGNPYRDGLYRISLETIDAKLGNKQGTFEKFKTQAKQILKNNNIPIYDPKMGKNAFGFNINEIAGVTGSAKSKAAEFSQFVDIMDGNINTKAMAGFQSKFSTARQIIENDPTKLSVESKKINKIAQDLEKRYNVELPRLRDPDATKYFSPARLRELNAQGLNIVKAAERAGYTVQVPKSAVTVQEFVQQTPKAVKGLKAFMKTNNIPCNLSQGLNCNFPQAYEKSLNELSTKAQAGDQAAAAKMTNFAKSVRGAGSVIKGVLGPAALAFEVGIAIPIGLFEYAQGKPATEIINTLTYGGFGKSREDRLKELMPEYGQVEKLQSLDESLQDLERLQKGTRGQRLRSKPLFEKTTEEFQTLAKPYLSSEDPTAAMLENLQKSQDLRQKLIDEDLQKKQDRTTQFDLSDPFMAAGGGIAKMAGVSSGPPPEKGPMSQGLPGLLKRVRNL